MNESTPFDRTPGKDGAAANTTANAKTSARRKHSTRRKGLRSPLKVADSYLLGEVVANTLRGLSWFGGLLLAFAVIAAVRQLVRDHLTMASMAEFLVYQMPRIFLFTLPMSLLFGIVQTFTEMSSRGEMTALSAGGMSFTRMLRAPILCAAVLAVFAFWVQESVVPWAEQRKTAVLQEQIAKSLQMENNLVWIEQRTDMSMERVIQADGFDPKANTLLRPSIQIWNDQRQVAFQIQAESARWDNERQMWHFINSKKSFGFLSDAQSDTESIGVESADTWIATDQVPPPTILQEQTNARDRMLEKQDFEMVSIGDLYDYRERQHAALQQIRQAEIRKDLQKRIHGATFGIHDKIATPLICIALVLVGAPLGVRPQRSSGGFSMGLSLLVLIIYYVVWSAATQLGKSGVAPPVMAAYAPLLLTTVIGAMLVYLKSR